MLIDWFTVVAQMINFLILVWLLKRFLYRPILNAIDAREQRIAEEIADADAKMNEAEKERNEFQQKNTEFEKQRNSYLNQAIDEAKAEHQRLLETARQESENLRAKQQQALINEQRSLHEALTHQAREEVFAIARKALTDLADSSLEERMTEIFIKRLRELNNEEMADLKSTFKSATQALLVRTVFDLPAKQIASIETAIREVLGEQKQIQFVTTGDLVSGIEISTAGHKIGWSIDNYLAALATSVDHLLKSEGRSQIKTDVINKSSNE
jgi:F-type H+-transporting ATPase subunit b